ncbi:hypothetical protein EGT71_02630 [Atlantibacter subterranea]|uniref:Uncharacterized protein n=1 Tax=Atlantibacter subterraneus TaxID=255519 RepID=A0A427V9L5_9ENTR|nr:hypothetical protein EGK67_05430 [Atlantibacter subterranea]RSE07591.1 hypothetical protein EGT84_03355 [Atlantibacter subterranea]RSE29424.1 hypothetical protein EGT71_02630 [Atlantibacter subterranea]
MRNDFHQRARFGKKPPKLAINFFLPHRRTKNRVSAGRQGIRAATTYPLFLWITLCIRVRKLVGSERIRGLRMN